MRYSENIQRLEELTPKMYDADIIFNIIRYVNDLIAVFNTDGFFVYVNDKWQEILGFTDLELTNKPMTEFIHPDDVEPTKKLWLNMVYKNESIDSFSNRYKHKNDGYVRLCWSSSVFIDGYCYAIARKCPHSFE